MLFVASLSVRSLGRGTAWDFGVGAGSSLAGFFIFNVLDLSLHRQHRDHPPQLQPFNQDGTRLCKNARDHKRT